MSRIICEIGRKATVVVNKEQNKFASAHDLRRAFGTRWASRITPALLQQIMRHASIETTLKYYVEQNADALAAELWLHDEAPKRERERIMNSNIRPIAMESGVAYSIADALGTSNVIRIAA